MLINNSIYLKNTNTNNCTKPSNVGFGKAYVNILSIADSHGVLTTLPDVFETIKKNSSEIFPNATKKNTLNLFAQVGDLFMNSPKKGYLTSHDITSGEMQLKVFEHLIIKTKELVKNKNVSAIYTPGNHCFDSGALPFNVEFSKEFDTILTNATLKKQSNVKKQTIYTLQDDKNPNLKHKLLVLGLMPQNLNFYMPNLKDVSILDASKKAYEKLAEEDQNETINDLKKRIEAFKKDNPKGAVLINAHIGEKIAEIIAKKTPGIDLILNGHDHKLGQKIINGTQIISHGQNNEIVRSERIFFDDDGNCSITKLNKYETKSFQPSNKNPLSIFLNTLFNQDMKPLLKINTKEALNIDGIRYSNNLLANLITDITHSKLLETNPQLNATGIMSSTFRGGLKDGASNLEIMKVLDGSTENMSVMHTATLKGSSILNILSDNVISNFQENDRNPITQWSGIIIDKKLFSELKDSNPEKIYKAFKIKCKNGDTENVYEEINPDKNYQIALPSKFVQKYCPKNLKDSFINTGKTINEIFIEHLKKNNYQLNIDSGTCEKRIIS